MNRANIFTTILRIPVDIAMILLGFYLAFMVRSSFSPLFHQVDVFSFLKIILVTLPLWLLFFTLSGLYAIKITDESKKIFLAVSASLATVLALGYMFPNPYFDWGLPNPIFPAKLIPFFGWIFTLTLIILGRQILKRIDSTISSQNHAVIIGNKKNTQKIISELNNTKVYRILASIGDYKIGGIAYYKSWEDFVSRAKINKIDEVIIADPALAIEEKLKIKHFADKNFWRVKIIPESIELSSARSTLATMGSIAILELHRTPLFGWGLIYKRGFDFLASLLFLIILSPVFTIIAVIIKFNSRGPIFYIHPRIGANGKQIKVYKFRTMVINADAKLKRILQENPKLKKEWQENFKLKKDPRVTKIGRFLRKTSLDELPQLFNVLKGEMSLIGPRPIKEEELERYGKNQPIFLSLLPGMTGLWQVSGRSDISYSRRVNLDIYYIENWSPFLDFKILLLTLPRLIRGAY